MLADSVGPRVIVGVSPSLTGLRALRLAVAEARRRGVPLRAVRAWDLDGTDAVYVRGRDAARQLIRECFADALGGMPPDVQINSVTVLDRPGAALVDYAREDDVLFVGRTPQRWWRRVFRRSVAGYCVSHAVCPVQVVPPDAFARQWQRRNVADAISRELSELTSG
ncbi:nucleotide-binding universal stress UspA family protein [Catenuloplanes nepalensis]|uniref:Nucleotide-binding universal stress UspA family protein n=1 Tax=Catenuloplanes nepalensis TaxID=587533 RepID=A0ABT9MV04_9ACTN|nr:universal stress protein [Catenuloplanes nepalensis]MDP9795199.1 nucleotide-binding universal stress UspA family protein [Catenuloplanes nepalensis]